MYERMTGCMQECMYGWHVCLYSRYVCTYGVWLCGWLCGVTCLELHQSVEWVGCYMSIWVVIYCSQPCVDGYVGWWV